MSRRDDGASGDELRAQVGRLAHDVGKHVARAARNISAGAPVPEAVTAMLVADLYALDGERRASLVFASSRPRLDDARLTRSAELLSEIDALEDAVRAARPDAVQRAAGLARAVEDELRSLAADLARERT